MRDLGVRYGMPPTNEQMAEYYRRLGLGLVKHRTCEPMRPEVPDYRRSPQYSSPHESIRVKSERPRTRHAKPAHNHRHHTGESHRVVTRRRDRADVSSGRRYPRTSGTRFGHCGPFRPGDVVFIQILAVDGVMHPLSPQYY